MKKIALVALSLIVLAGTFAAAQQPPAPGAPGQPQRQRPAPDPRSMGGGDCRDNPYNCDDVANPLPATNTVWLEEMTWIDVRDALKAGKTNVIVPTGGMEPNGVVAGHRQAQLRAACELRSHRPQDGQRPVRADRQVRARGRHRTEDQPHDLARHDHRA